MKAVRMAMQLVGALALLICVGAGVAEAADARKGETLSRRWCAACHVVASNQRQPTAEATPFAEIAKRQKFEAAHVAFFLLGPHPKMPDMSLSRSEAGDIAAYIGSLHK